MGLDAVEDCLLTGGQGIREGTTKYGNFFLGTTNYTNYTNFVEWIPTASVEGGGGRKP